MELEIQSLLIHFGQADLAADALIKKYENEKLNLAEFEALSTFLLHSGFCATLTDLIVRKLDDKSIIPWGHFAEALCLSSDQIETEIKSAMIEGSEESHLLSHLSRSHSLDHFEAELERQRTLRRQSFVEKNNLYKQELFQQLELMRSQNLHQEEEKLLSRMLRLFPDDNAVPQAQAALKHKAALDYVAKRIPSSDRKPVIYYHEKQDPKDQMILDQIEKSMHRELAGKDNSQLAEDFAIAHFTLDNWQATKRLLETTEPFLSADWLKAEALLESRHFVDLLSHLNWIEMAYSDDAEMTFAVLYMKAQALWGLEQKFLAIEILESLVQIRPQYRGASALLDLWKELA